MATRNRATKRKSNDRNYGQQLLQDVLSVAGTLIRGQKTRGAEGLQAFAGATREYAGSLVDVPVVQNYVNLAADSVDTLADYVSDTDLEDMISDASTFARRQPIATAAVAVSLGLIATLAVYSQSLGQDKSARRTRSKNAASARAATASSSTNGSRRKRPSSAKSRNKSGNGGADQSASNA